MHIEVTDIDEGENANIFITVEASTDPDYRDNHEDFIDNNETYRFNLKVKDFDINNAPIDANKLIAECQKGFDTIMRALLLFQNKEEWKKLVANAMTSNYSWQHSAKEYQKIYKKMIG